nr:hypothetical protein [Tanacetum cinerariifolium]
MTSAEESFSSELRTYLRTWQNSKPEKVYEPIKDGKEYNPGFGNKHMHAKRRKGDDLPTKSSILKSWSTNSEALSKSKGVTPKLASYNRSFNRMRRTS